MVNIEFNPNGVVTQAKSARRVLRQTERNIDKHDNALLLAGSWALNDDTANFRICTLAAQFGHE